MFSNVDRNVSFNQIIRIDLFLTAQLFSDAFSRENNFKSVQILSLRNKKCEVIVGKGVNCLIFSVTRRDCVNELLSSTQNNTSLYQFLGKKRKDVCFFPRSLRELLANSLEYQKLVQQITWCVPEENKTTKKLSCGK